MEIKFTTNNYPWSIAGLKTCINDNKLKGVKILAENNYTAAVYIPTYQASVILGAMSDWCISQHKCSWKQYVSDNNNVQMFFFDFTRKPSSELTLIGATYTEKGVICAFTRGNHPLHEVVKKEDDQKALYEEIISKNFSDSQWFIIDEAINSMFKKNEPVKEKIVEIDPSEFDCESVMESKTETIRRKSWIDDDDFWYDPCCEDEYAWGYRCR